MIARLLRRIGLFRNICKEGHVIDPSWKICPICISPVCGWLVVMNGDLKNKVYILHQGKSKIGTGVDCEVRVLYDSVSREHAMIMGKGKHYMITDLNSVGGTFINNNQVSHKDIIDGDIIKLGEIELIFKCI
jgi:hypothetical protein